MIAWRDERSPARDAKTFLAAIEPDRRPPAPGRHSDRECTDDSPSKAVASEVRLRRYGMQDDESSVSVRPERSMSAWEQVDGMTGLGLRNREIIGLVARHCRNARVEKSPLMGQGMLEAATGLPIDGREIRCPHAQHGSSASVNLEGVAVDFYRRNCVGCEYRDPVGIPNLKTLVDDLDEQQRQAEETVARRETELERARQSRSAHRREAALAESEPTRRLIALLDGVDAAEPDERAGQLIDLARAAPELCTPVAAQLILETGRAAPTDELVEVIAHLRRQSRIEDEAALEVSLAALAIRPSHVAAELMVDLQHLVTQERIGPAISAIIALAGPIRWFGEDQETFLAPIAVAARVDLPAVLDRLLELLSSQHKPVRASAARAAQSLLVVEPSTAEVLVRPLLDALTLPGSNDPYMGSPKPPLLAALRAAVRAASVQTTAVVLERGQHMPADQQGALVRVFDGLVRRRAEAAENAEVLDQAVSACLKIADGRWGERPAVEAADALELFASRVPDALVPHSAGLLGILMAAVDQPLEVEQIPGLEGLAQGAAEAVRSGRLSKLTGAIGELLSARPDALRDDILAVLDAADLPGEQGLQLRRKLVELLAAVGSRPEGLRLALPRLYSALLHADTGVRASGVKAWRELATSSRFAAPRELEDLMPLLLVDPFVAVHREMVIALLLGLPVPERHSERVMLSLLHLARVYSSEDGYFLDDVLRVAWRVRARGSITVGLVTVSGRWE